MRPSGEEVLRGIQKTLTTYILPEMQTEHARLELMLVTAVLGVAAGDWDGAAQRLVDDNAALRELGRRGAEALAAAPAAAGQESAALADELRSLADEADPSLRLSDLSAANAQLGAALARLSVLLDGSDAPALQELRAAVIDRLREQAEARSLSLLGPRADG